MSSALHRHTVGFPVANVDAFKRSLRAWAQQYPVALYLDSNQAQARPLCSRETLSPQPYWRQSRWECLLAVGEAEALCAEAGSAFGRLRHFLDSRPDWLFGFLCYDLKNEVERLFSRHPRRFAFPDLYFFRPQIVVAIRAGSSSPPDAFVEVHSLSRLPKDFAEEIAHCDASSNETAAVDVRLKPRMSPSEYFNAVSALQEHIAAGDVYEVNLCQEFYAEGGRLPVLSVFERLNQRAQAPFSAFLRRHDHYLLCASPERFLAKRGRQLFSQPIKGTRRRLPDAAADARLREALLHSEKERAENAMIVDLVRNDLARHCLPGSVTVEELFGIYTFPTVHQMISTISGRLAPNEHPVTALRDAFPMGSMTGAPKIRAMQLIDQYECCRRELYSGAVGYFSPTGDFDFNVVIRSILYRADIGYLSCSVGSAIVYDSNPEEEYEECLVKLEAMKKSVETLRGQ